MSSLFINREDIELVEDLDQNGALGRGTWSAMRIEGNERMSTVLLRNHSLIKGPSWITWLVTRHGCLPLAKVSVSREWVRAQGFTKNMVSYFRDEGVVPIAKETTGWLLATMLPCVRAKWEARFNEKVFLIAATPSDIVSALPWF